MNRVTWDYVTKEVDTVYRVVEPLTGEKRSGEDDLDNPPTKIRKIDPDNLEYGVPPIDAGDWSSLNPNYNPNGWGDDSDDEEDDWGQPVIIQVLIPKPLRPIGFACAQEDITIGNEIEQFFEENSPDELKDNYGPGYDIMLRYGDLDTEIRVPVDPMVYRPYYSKKQINNGFCVLQYRMMGLCAAIQDHVLNPE